MRPPRPPRIRTPKPPRPSVKTRMPSPRSAPQAQITSAPLGRAGSDLAGVVAQSLFGAAPQVIEMTVPTPTPEPSAPEGDAMKPTVGSVLQYTPDARGWIANLTDEEGNEWAEPVVGWAVVVTWAGYASEDEAEREGQPDEFQTEVQPVLFADGALELLMFREGVSLDGLTMPGQIG